MARQKTISRYTYSARGTSQPTEFNDEPAQSIIGATDKRACWFICILIVSSNYCGATFLRGTTPQNPSIPLFRRLSAHDVASINKLPSGGYRVQIRCKDRTRQRDLSPLKRRPQMGPSGGEACRSGPVTEQVARRPHCLDAMGLIGKGTKRDRRPTGEERARSTAFTTTNA